MSDEIPYILTHRVVRPFNGDGTMLKAGQCINASDWRNAAALERQKYMIPLGPDEAERELKALREAAKKKPSVTTKPFGNGGKPPAPTVPVIPTTPEKTDLDAQDEYDLDDPPPAGDNQPPK